MEVNRNQNCLVINIISNIFFCFTEESHIGLKWHDFKHNVKFCLEYPFEGYSFSSKIFFLVIIYVILNVILNLCHSKPDIVKKVSVFVHILNLKVIKSNVV